MNAEINPGDPVVYYPKQADRDNLHFAATVLARAKRHNFFMIEVYGGKKNPRPSQKACSRPD